MKVYLVYVCWFDEDERYMVDDLDVIYSNEQSAKNHVKELKKVNKGSNLTYEIVEMKVLD